MHEVTTPNTLSEKLKEGTKNNHQNLEKELLKRLKIIRSSNEYAELLTHFYSFFGGLELCIDKHLDLNILPDYPYRRKTSAILNDLRCIDAVLPALAEKSALPEIGNHFQALGALYVIEGSTLGGQIICKILRGQVSCIDPAAMSFFSGYGDQTYQMWNVFKQAIDLIKEPEDENMVIVSANHTFLEFSNWFGKNG